MALYDVGLKGPRSKPAGQYSFYYTQNLFALEEFMNGPKHSSCVTADSQRAEKPPRLFLEGLIEGKARILYDFAWGWKQEDNLGELAKKWGYASGGGRFNINVNELVDEGYLKRFAKGNKRYLKITFKGEKAILPLILPRLMFLFSFITGMALISEALPGLLVGFPVPPLYIAIMGLVLLVFAMLGLFLLDRVERILLKRE